MKSANPLATDPGSVGSHLLAHQGGWDEVLLVVGPLAVVAALLWLANRRVSAQLQEAEQATADDQGSVEGSSETDPRS